MKLKRIVERFLECILVILSIPLIMVNDFNISALPFMILWILSVGTIIVILVKYGKDF